MFFHCSDKTREKLMKEYRLTWREFFDATKPPICVIWKKDPITGIPKFPKREDYTEEDLEKYARENIEEYFTRFIDLDKINDNLREYYNLSEEEMLIIIGYNVFVLDNREYNIKIRNEWIRKIERYLRNRKKEPKFSKTLTIGNTKLEVSELSVPYLKEKLKLKKKEAERYFKIIEKDYIINYNGIRRRESDDSPLSSKAFVKRNDKEKIYQRAIDIIKKNSLEKVSRTYLMKKLKLNYSAVSMIIEVLIERGYLEESKEPLNGFKVI